MSGCIQGCGATEIFVSPAPAPAPGEIAWLLVRGDDNFIGRTNVGFRQHPLTGWNYSLNGAKATKYFGSVVQKNFCILSLKVFPSGILHLTISGVCSHSIKRQVHLLFSYKAVFCLNFSLFNGWFRLFPIFAKHRLASEIYKTTCLTLMWAPAEAARGEAGPGTPAHLAPCST